MPLGLHECAQDEQIEWKSRSQIIEFAAVDAKHSEMNTGRLKQFSLYPK